MTKDLRIKIFSFVLASVVSMTAFFPCLGVITHAAPTSWEDVGDDAIALRDAYYEYFLNSTSGDLLGAFKTAKDIPIAWLTTLKDGVLAISPADDIYYYIKNNFLCGAVSHGGGGGRSGLTRGKCAVCGKTYSNCTCDYFTYAGNLVDVSPEVSGKNLKDIASDYNSRYMPMANEDQYFYHFHGDNTSSYDNSKWDFTPYCPVYIFEKQWGNKSWTDFYFIPVLSDDDKTTFYGQQYGHIYAKNVDGNTTMYFDLINMSDDSIAKSFSFVYDATTYKWIGLQFNGSLYNIYGFSSSYNYLNGKLVGGQYAEYGPFVQGINMLSWDGSSTIGLNFLLSDPTFSPKTNKNDDWGYILSNQPFELFANQTKIDFDRVPDNYFITIEGDNIFNYPITDPSSGKSTTINNYITNNYIIGDSGDGGGSGGNTTNWNIDFPDFITNITTSIETALTNVFVADVDIVNGYNSEMQDMLNKKLPFISDFGDIFSSLFVEIIDNNFVYAGDIQPEYRAYNSGGSSSDGTSEAASMSLYSSSGGSSGSGTPSTSPIYPKWSVNIDFFGQKMNLVILDFGMYAQPLYYVRLIACIFIYVVYFVNLMKYLPTLIGGVLDCTGRVISATSKKDGE